MKTDLNDPRTWDTSLFPVTVAAHAALTAPGTMRMWFQRGRIELRQSEAAFEAAAMPEKPGQPRLLTLRTVLTIAAAAALSRKGVEVADAYTAAKQWTYLGGDSLTSDRDPAGLFPDPAWTMLVHYSAAAAKVIPVDGSNKGGLIFQYPDLFRGANPLPAVPTIVFLNYVDRYARGICGGWLRGGRGGKA